MSRENADAPERAPTVILFAETRGFTRMSEMLDPAVALARVSEFFGLVSAAVEQHEGVVLHLLNDTVMATFTGADDAPHAVDAARRIQSEFALLAERWQSEFGLKAAVAMGLHSGDAVLGYTDGALADRLLVLGDCVSVAERLLHRARSGEFVFSEGVMEVLRASGYDLEAAPLPPLEMARREPIHLFGVLLDTRLDFT
ncbi:MAG TPA: adenylate/guanylate cyclase domain-containing protein [Burkholderiales bacterium]